MVRVETWKPEECGVGVDKKRQGEVMLTKLKHI